MQDSAARGRRTDANNRRSGVQAGQPAGESPAKRTRLPPSDREAMILEAAIDFFAENGFEAQLRELAERIGISQALIFRYFPSKQVLVERVYERVYVARWSAQWRRGLEDRTIPLRDRLMAFYGSYVAAIDGYEWIRLTLYSGLADNDLTRRYIETRVDGLILLIAREIRHDIPAAHRMTPAILHELVWHLHGTFIYYLIRKYVFQVPTEAHTSALIEATVTNFLNGLTAGTAPDRSRRKRASGNVGTD